MVAKSDSVLYHGILAVFIVFLLISLMVRCHAILDFKVEILIVFIDILSIILI